MDVKLSFKNYLKHIQCGYSMSTIWTLGDIENKHDIHRGEYCMKSFLNP